MTRSVDSLFPGGSTAQTVNVTGQKTYIGEHDVYYRGFRDGKGIWGLWELPGESGGFYIWPLRYEEGEQNHESAEDPEPVEAVAAET